LQFGINLGLHASQELKDRFQISDVFGLVSDFMQVPDLLKNKQAILDEVKDLSFDEISQLISAVKDSTLITSDSLKEIISIALDVLEAVMKLIGIFKK
jgi:hypothetical protein